MGEFLETVIKNKHLSRPLGIIFTAILLTYLFSGGGNRLTGDTSLGSGNYLWGIFLIELTFMLLLGILFLLAGFSKKTYDD